jgi:membrane glycosyltransferase
LWWALHHLTFQLAGLWKRKSAASEPPARDTRFAILYVTCDDFQDDACLSCVKQDYPAGLFQVLICDDSSEKRQYRQRIDEFRESNPQVVVVRRAPNADFKAGNLNNAFANHIPPEIEWVVVADADEILPSDYLWSLASVVAQQDNNTALSRPVMNPPTC